MGNQGHSRQRRKLLRDVGDTLSELEKANSLEEEMLGTEDLGKITKELLQEVRDAEDPMAVIQSPEIRAKAAAVVREASRRRTKEHLRHYDVQIVGGLSLADKSKNRKGSVVEMKTGEGKTLTATIPLYISSLLEKGSWLITVNDYLARRDAEWMGGVFTELGRTVAVLAPMNDRGIQPSYIYDPDEERADFVKKIHQTMGIEVVTEDGKKEWVFDKECWDADNRAFTDKGLERLVEEGIISSEFVPSVEHISAAENILTMNYILQAMKKNKVPPQVSKPYLQKVRDYKNKNPGRFIKISDAFNRKEGDEGAIEGVHYTFEYEQGRAKLTPEGLKLLSDKGFIDAPEVDGHSLGDKLTKITDLAWGISEGILLEDMPHLRLATRKEAYDADITYGPSHQFVFDWLGDKHQATDCCQQVQRENPPGQVILDEVDYILIDDARTPHILNHEIEGVPSPYRFCMALPHKVRDFEMYEWSAAKLHTEVQRCMDVHTLLVEKFLPLRDFADGRNGAEVSERLAKKTELELKKMYIRSTDIHGENEAVITALDQFEEGVHFERRTRRSKTEYRITDEGYQLLHELGATTLKFNIHEIQENRDSLNMGFIYTMMQPNALIKHLLEQERDFIYEPIDKKLRLTDRGSEKLKKREVLPPDEVVEQCGQVYMKLVEELLPLKHSKSKLRKRWFKSALKEIEGEPLHDAFEEFLEDVHYRLRPMPDEGTKDFVITEEGFHLLYNFGAIPHPSADADSVAIEHGVCNVLKAMKIFNKDEKYVIQPRMDPKTGKLKPQVILIDENSGRYMEGRRLSDGLHEAIEAVNGVPIEQANGEVAKISQQMFYDMLPWVAGMSGTAETSWKEFRDVYDLNVKVLPTNVQWRWLSGELERNVEKIKLEGWPFPMDKISYTDPKTGDTFHERLDLPQVLVGMISEEQLEKNEELFEEFLNYKCIVETVRKRGQDIELPDALEFNTAQFTHYKLLIDDTMKKVEQGRPILLHTVDPNVSKELGEVLKHKAKQCGLDVTVNVLYHENHDREAKIIEEAGKPFVVTIATNMAGRGVDIKLTEEAREAGGLYNPGAESNISARNDNQVRGRAGRQGDPGSSQQFISTLDSYLKPLGGEKLAKILQPPQEGEEPWYYTILSKLGNTIKPVISTLGNTIKQIISKQGNTISDEIEEGFQGDEALDGAWISTPFISRLLNSIQAQIEERHAESREHTLDYDKVLDEQRTAFLKGRQRILDLDADSTKEHILGWYNDYIDDIIDKSCSEEDGTIDYQKVSKLFGRTGAYSLTMDGLASRLEDDTEKERLRQDYMGWLDKALEREHISQEERDRLGKGVEAALEKNLLPRDIIIRANKKVPLRISPEEIGGAIKEFNVRMKELEEGTEEVEEEERQLAMDEFFDKLDNHIYSKALSDLVSQKIITQEDYDREFKGISDFLRSQRDKLEKLGEGEKMTFPAAIRKNAPQNVPYDHSGFFEGIIMGTNDDELEEMLKGYVSEAYDARGTAEEQFIYSRGAMLQSMDNAWINHLLELESVRTGLKFPSRDPLVQYKREGTVLFHEMMGSDETLGSIKRDFVSGQTGYFKITPTQEETQKRMTPPRGRQNR